MNFCRIPDKDWLFYSKQSFTELSALMVTGWRMNAAADNASVALISYDLAMKGWQEWHDWLSGLQAFDVEILNQHGENEKVNIPAGVLSSYLGQLDPAMPCYGIIDANSRFGAYLCAQYIAAVHLKQPLSGVIPYHVVELPDKQLSEIWVSRWKEINFKANTQSQQGKRDLNEVELFLRACTLGTTKEALIGRELGLDKNARGMLQRIGALVCVEQIAPNVSSMLRANAKLYSGLDKDTSLKACGRGTRTVGHTKTDIGTIVALEEMKPWFASDIYQWIPKGRKYKHPDVEAFEKAQAEAGIIPAVEKPQVDVKALADSNNLVISAIANAISSNDTKALESIQDHTKAINTLINALNSGSSVSIVQNGTVIWEAQAAKVEQAETVPTVAETVEQAETVPKDTSKKRAK